MAIVRFDPFREMERLQSEVNRLFEGYNGSTDNGRSESGNVPAFAQRVWSPSVDVAETSSEVVLRAELPGIKQDEIDIELNGDTLVLRGERKWENEERKNNFVRVERSYGRFQRSFTLGVPVQQDQVTAAYTDGVLEIHLPKSEANKPRKVQIASGGSETNNALNAAPSADQPTEPQEISGRAAQTTDAGTSR